VRKLFYTRRSRYVSVLQKKASGSRQRGEQSQTASTLPQTFIPFALVVCGLKSPNFSVVIIIIERAGFRAYPTVHISEIFQLMLTADQTAIEVTSKECSWLAFAFACLLISMKRPIILTVAVFVYSTYHR